MTKSECRMSKENRNPKFKWNANRSCLSPSDFEIRASFVIGHSSFPISILLPGAAPHCVRESVQHFHGRLPADARIGDTLAIAQAAPSIDDLLPALDQMAFQHDAADGARASSDLSGNVGGDDGLADRVLATVVVAAIDHQPRRERRLNQNASRRPNTPGVIVRSIPCTPQKKG